MSETNAERPEDGFTFVDKRRNQDITDEAAVEQPISEVDNSENETGESESAATTHSIYEVAAYCAGMLINEGFTRLGLIADPQTGKAVLDLQSSRVAIDCVAALVQVLDEPSSTLPESVRRELKRTLNDLRLNYIQRKSI